MTKSPTIWDVDTINLRLGVLTWQPPSDEQERETVWWAIKAYGFVLPPGRYMYPQFAEEIAKVYDGANPRTAAALELLRAL
jgi:hypothetical protein